MSRKTKVILAIFAGVIVVIGSPICYFYVHYVPIYRSYAYPVQYIDLALESYVESNQGEFPKSEDDLKKQGFLRKIDSADGHTYQVWSGELPIWVEVEHFEEFIIKYGARVDDIVSRGNELYDVHSDERIFLIDGPHKKLLENFYLSFSKYLYDRMVRYSKQSSTSVKRLDDNQDKKTVGKPGDSNNVF